VKAVADGIILIHAFPMDSSMWAPQVAALTGLTTVVAPNLPGFGGSGSGGSVMTMSSAADQVAKAAAEAGISRALVCGLSMGGYVALALWREHRSLVAGFVFANTKADADDDAGKERRQQLANRLLSEGSGFLVQSPPPLLSESAGPDLVSLVRTIIAAQPPESIAAASLGMAARPDSTPDLAGITVPTLVVTGSKDTLIPPAATKPIADGVRGAGYEVIDGVGHLSNLEAPERFSALLREQFAKLP
jgi:pimeloyl-ACP methyl ester carboxylesterase